MFYLSHRIQFVLEWFGGKKGHTCFVGLKDCPYFPYLGSPTPRAILHSNIKSCQRSGRSQRSSSKLKFRIQVKISKILKGGQIAYGYVWALIGLSKVILDARSLVSGSGKEQWWKLASHLLWGPRPYPKRVPLPSFLPYSAAPVDCNSLLLCGTPARVVRAVPAEGEIFRHSMDHGLGRVVSLKPEDVHSSWCRRKAHR